VLLVWGSGMYIHTYIVCLSANRAGLNFDLVYVTVTDCVVANVCYHLQHELSPILEFLLTKKKEEIERRGEV
jgi:hypothetical protein